MKKMFEIPTIELQQIASEDIILTSTFKHDKDGILDEDGDDVYDSGN